MKRRRWNAIVRLMVFTIVTAAAAVGIADVLVALKGSL